MEISKLLEELQLSDLHATDEDGNTALHLTVDNETLTQKDMIDRLQILLDRGIDPDIKNKYNETVLQMAVLYRMKDVVNFLISCRINMDSVPHFFIESEYRRFFRLSTEENGPDELAISDIEKIENESANYVQWLISKGFDFDWENERYDSALYVAIEYNLQHVLPVLLKYTKNIHSIKGRNTTLLYSFLENNSFYGLEIISKNWYSNRYAADIVKILLDRGVSTDAKSHHDYTPAQIAFKNRADIEVMDILIAQSTNINHQVYEDKYLHSLLQIVIHSFIGSNESEIEYHMKILRAILAKGANIDELNKCYEYGYTVLSLAVTARNIHAIEFLQENGADFSVITTNRENLLHLLVNRHLELNDKKIDEDAEMTLFTLLISKGCQVNAKDKDGRTPLYEAVYHGNLTIVRKLVEHGADVNYKVRDVKSPLQVAVGMKYNLRLVEFLREHGADFSVTTEDDENLLHLFAKRYVHMKIDGDVEMTLFNLLIDEGCQVNAKDVKGNTPLHNAVTCDNVAIVQRLLDHGAEVNCKTNDGMTPLQIAVSERHKLDVIELLEVNGADFSVITRNDENLLHLLVKRPDYLKADDETDIKLLNLFISKGCEVNAKDKNGKTPLHEAVNYDGVPIIRNLIERGAEVNCTTADGETPLLIAATKKYNPFVVELLQENGADLNVTKIDGETLIRHLLKSSKFMEIEEESQVKLFNLIASEDRQIHAKDETGTSLIHVAAEHANVAIVRLLIERGANVNCRNNQMETPLHFSTTNNQAADIAELLLEHGAYVNAKDLKDLTALQKVANEPRSKHSGGMVFTLLNYGADVNTKDARGMTALNYARLRDKADYEKKGREWIQNYHSTSYLEDEYNYYNDDRLTPENYYQMVTEWASWPVILLAWHSIKLKAANLPWDRKINGWLGDFEMFAGSNYCCKQHYEDCLVEVEKLKETIIDNRVSLYSFLHMNPSDRCVYVNNEELQKLVKSELCQQFPEYYVLILANYREANTRKSLLESAKEAWLELTKIDLPDLCLECIFSFLSDSDLIDMIEKD